MIIEVSEEQLVEIKDDIINATCLLWEDDLGFPSNCIRILDLQSILEKYFLDFKIY